MSTINRKAIRAKVRRRIRRKLSGTASRPRLAVYFSNRHVYAQIIDDTVGKTICSASTADASIADPSKLVQGPCDAVKLLGNGTLTKSLNVVVDFVSASAREKVTQAGGTVTVLSEA